jgi:stage III sporulation protein SpoIIIAA
MEKTFVAHRRGTVTISCVHGNELSDLIKDLAFQEQET